MKLLKDILYKVRIEELIGNTNIAITNIVFDSRQVNKDSLFVAVKGTAVDGHEYIEKAIESGAKAIICEILPESINENIIYISVKDSSEALGQIAANFYDNPSEKLKLVGVTGTNGKTTVTTLLHKLFLTMDKKAGLLSTVNIKINNKVIPATHTTPDPVTTNRLLSEMLDEGCKYCFMEVSSHAMVQNRTYGLEFKGGAFTNITHDHLDYHKTFDDYILAKKKFFDNLPASAFALVNQDDRHGFTMLHHTKAHQYSFGMKTDADYKVRILENQFSGLLLQMDSHEIWTKLIGSFNAYNLVSVYAVARLLDQDKMNTLTALSTLSSVEGRFQYIKSDGITAIVDYAHTPDALKNVLSTINDIRTGNETVIAVVGCGGDRDKTKRPVMAEIACEMSTKVILTSDNPRTENPEQIIKDMKEGVEPQHYKKVLSITDRKEAIRTACSLADEGDIILVAGKGHEKYQDINGVKHPFDDLQVLSETLQTNNK